MKSPVSTFAVIAAGLLSIFIQQVTEAQDPASAAEPGVPVPAPPSIRPGPSELERPGLGQLTCPHGRYQFLS